MGMKHSACLETLKFFEGDNAALRAERNRLAALNAELRNVIEAAVLDGSGRSGGSVYLILKEQFLALKAALAKAGQTQAKGG
jgi:hypothetical protein